MFKNLTKVALLCVLVGGCASMKEKCVMLDIGEGGNLNITAPNTAWFSVNLGTITGTGPVKLESCPVERSE